MDPLFDQAAVVRALRAQPTEMKRALLDQTLVSGIGNIYADEALWRGSLHWARPTDKLTSPHARAVLSAATDVMNEALGRAARRSTRCTSTLTASPATSTAHWTFTARRISRARRCGTPIRASRS